MRIVYFWFAVLIGHCSGTCLTRKQDCNFTYGPWSDCDPCLNTQSRHLNITSLPQFGGRPCPSDLAEIRVCNAENARCLQTQSSCVGLFDCGFDGRCVEDSLLCNGDNDCGNNEDERNCTLQQFPRSVEECLKLKPVPYLEQIGSGLDLATGEPMGRVLDNQRYQGLCRTAISGNHEQTFRLPYNVDNVHFQVRSSDQLETKVFHSLADYSREQDSSSGNSWGESVDAKVDFLFFSASLSESMSYTHKRTFKRIYSTMKDRRASLFSISASMEVAQFIFKDVDLLLDAYFENSLRKLPAKLDPNAYFNLFDQYGAFYPHSGVLGGRYEHNYIFTDEDVLRSGQNTSTLTDCLKFSMSASLGFFFKASASGGYENCKDSTGTVKNASDVENSATKNVVKIEGGTVSGAGRLAGAALAGNGSFQRSKLEEWVLGVQKNPVLLRKSLRPICDLFLSSKSPDVVAKYNSCLTAITLYYQRSNAVGCESCANRGKAVNIRGQCQCACPRGFKGEACMEQDLGGLSAGIGLEMSVKKPTLAEGIKFLVSGDPPVVTDPPYLQKLNINRKDGMLRFKGNSVYYLSSTLGQFFNNGTTFIGDYSIVQLSEYLDHVRSVPVDFSTITECGKPTTSLITCEVRDFDIDIEGQFVISVRITTTDNRLLTSLTYIYKLDRSGKAILSIPEPCFPGGGDLGIYVSTTCDGSVLVSCPGFFPATIRMFSSAGRPKSLNQFPSFTYITSVQFFNGSVWFHTDSNQIAAYDISTWTQVFNTSSVKADPATRTLYSQIFVDSNGILLIAQAFDAEKGKDDYQLSIMDLTVDETLALVNLTNWNECASVASYNKKLYTLCKDMVDTKAILVFDYLK